MPTSLAVRAARSCTDPQEPTGPGRSPARLRSGRGRQVAAEVRGAAVRFALALTLTIAVGALTQAASSALA